MIACVERRFGTIRTPHPIQWLSDNGSVYSAARTIDLAVALGLVPCFTPAESRGALSALPTSLVTRRRACDGHRRHGAGELVK
jgi:transposase InsO family protein